MHKLNQFKIKASSTITHKTNSQTGMELLAVN